MNPYELLVLAFRLFFAEMALASTPKSCPGKTKKACTIRIKLLKPRVVVIPKLKKRPGRMDRSFCAYGNMPCHKGRHVV